MKQITKSSSEEDENGGSKFRKMREKYSSKLFALGFRNDFSLLLKMSIPLFVSNLSQVLSQIVSLIFCGHLGETELDGVALAYTLIDVFGIVFVLGLLSASDTLFPQIFGGPNKKLLGLYVQKSLIISILSCIPVVGILYNSRNIMLLIVKDKQIAIVAYDYILYYLPSLFFMSISNVIIKYIQSQNIVIPLMIINVIAFVFNAIFHAIFLHVFKMGVIGGSLAVDLSGFMLIVMLLAYVYKRKLHKETWGGWTFEAFSDWKVYLKLAIPGLAMMLIEWSNFEIGTFVSGIIDEIELGSMSICQQVLYIFFQIPFSIAIAGNIHIGQLLGSNLPDKAKNATKVFLVMSETCSFLICITILALADFIPYIFSSEQAVIDRSIVLLRVCSLVHIVDAAQGNFAAVLRSVGAQFYGSITILISFYIIGTPIGISITLLTSLKGIGFLLGVIIGCMLLISFQLFYIFRIDWKQKAQEAFELSANDEIVLEENNYSLKSMENPNFQSSDKKKKVAKETMDNESEDTLEDEEEENVVEGDQAKIMRKRRFSWKNPNLIELLKRRKFRLTLINRFVVLTILVGLTIGLILMRNLNPIENYENQNETTTAMTNNYSTSSYYYESISNAMATTINKKRHNKHHFASKYYKDFYDYSYIRTLLKKKKH